MPDGFVKIGGPTPLPQIRLSLITATIIVMDNHDAFQFNPWRAGAAAQNPGEAARTGSTCQFS